MVRLPCVQAPWCRAPAAENPGRLPACTASGAVEHSVAGGGAVAWKAGRPSPPNQMGRTGNLLVSRSEASWLHVLELMLWLPAMVNLKDNWMVQHSAAFQSLLSVPLKRRPLEPKPGKMFYLFIFFCPVRLYHLGHLLPFHGGRTGSKL